MPRQPPPPHSSWSGPGTALEHQESQDVVGEAGPHDVAAGSPSPALRPLGPSLGDTPVSSAQRWWLPCSSWYQSLLPHQILPHPSGHWTLSRALSFLFLSLLNVSRKSRLCNLQNSPRIPLLCIPMAAPWSLTSQLPPSLSSHLPSLSSAEQLA